MPARHHPWLFLVPVLISLALLLAAPGGRAQEPDTGPRIYVACRGADVVTVLDPTRESPLLALVPYAGIPSDVAVSRDGSRVYLADSRTSRIEVLEAGTGRSLAAIPAPGAPHALSISPDGSRLYVAGSGDNSLSVISTAANRVVSRRSVGDRPVDVTVSPDGGRVYVSHEGGGNVWVMNPTTSVVFGTPQTGPGTSGAAAASNGNLYVIRGAANSLMVLNAASRVVAELRLPGAPRDVAVGPDGRFVYATAGNQVAVLDTRTNQIAQFLPAGTTPTGIAVNVAQKRVLVTNAGSGTVSRIDATTNQVLNTIAVGGAPGEMSLSPDGTRLFTAGPIGGQAGTLAILDPERPDRRLVAELAVRRPEALALSPDARRVWAASTADGTVAEVDTTTNQILRTLRVGADPAALAIHPDGSRVYVANRGSDTLSIVPTDPANQAPPVRTIPVGGRPASVAAAPDGRRVYVLNAGSRDISVIDTATDTVTERLFLGTNGPARILVSADSRRLYATSSGSSVLSQFDVTRAGAAPFHTALPFRPLGLDAAPAGSPLYVAGTGNTGEGMLGFVEVAADLRLQESVPLADSSAPVGVYAASSGRIYVGHAPHPVLSVVDPITRRVANVLLVDAEPLAVTVKP